MYLWEEMSSTSSYSAILISAPSGFFFFQLCQVFVATQDCLWLQHTASSLQCLLSVPSMGSRARGVLARGLKLEAPGLEVVAPGLGGGGAWDRGWWRVSSEVVAPGIQGGGT